MEKKVLTGGRIGGELHPRRGEQQTYKPRGWSSVRERKEEDEERGEKEWGEGGRTEKTCFASFKSSFFPMYRQGQEGLPGTPRTLGSKHSRWRWWGLDPDGVEKRGPNLRMGMRFGIRANRIC